MELQRLFGSLLDEVYDAVHVEGDDGFLAFIGFQEGEAKGRIHESVLGKDACGVGVLEDLEGGFNVGVSIGGRYTSHNRQYTYFWIIFVTTRK